MKKFYEKVCKLEELIALDNSYRDLYTKKGVK